MIRPHNNYKIIRDNVPPAPQFSNKVDNMESLSPREVDKLRKWVQKEFHKKTPYYENCTKMSNFMKRFMELGNNPLDIKGLRIVEKQTGKQYIAESWTPYHVKLRTSGKGDQKKEVYRHEYDLYRIELFRKKYSPVLTKMIIEFLHQQMEVQIDEKNRKILTAQAAIKKSDQP